MMRRRLLSALFIVTALLCACNKRPRLDRLSHESARYAAEVYYSYLVEGKYDEYVSTILGSDSMDENYRSQLKDLIGQHAMKGQNFRGGILQVESIADSLWDNEAQVFLNILFADSTTEQVDLPLVFQNGKWWIE